MKKAEYVHGYSRREQERLYDQAETLDEMLHHDSVFPAGVTILEAGCGVGAQTVILAGKNPQASIVSVDISAESVRQAKAVCDSKGITNVSFHQADIFNLPFEEESFDHVFVCFVLEHLPEPGKAIRQLGRVLKKGGTMTVIEGDHGSCYFYPDSREARQAIQCQIAIQAAMGGNSLIGREIYPLLTGAGFERVRVSPRMVYVDGSKPELIEGFTKNTFTAMVEGVGEEAIRRKMIDEQAWKKGIRDLYRTAEADGVFCYTFFKGVGTKK
jgi:SAM-dependent methyltransferase